MRRSILFQLFIAASFLSSVVATAQDQQAEPDEQAQLNEQAQPADPRSDDLAKINAAVAAYAEAFNSKDVDKLVALWTPDGVYISETSGERFSGHEELKSEFSAILSGESPPKLALESDEIEFVSPNVAVERGTAVVTSGEETSSTRYRTIYIEDDGKWLIDRVSEQSVVEQPTHYEELKGLKFLVGQWVTEGDGTVIEFDCQWTAHQNFLSRTYRVVRDEEIESSGLQVIGWDAKEKQVRSWLFDSDGGFVKGKWEPRDDGWAIHSVATLPDGATASSTTIIEPVDENSFLWRKTNRVLDGQLQPNTDQTLVERR